MQQNQKTRGGFKVKKSVTLPVVKLKPGEERYLQFVGPMHQSKDTGQVMNGRKMDPATVAEVIDLETGENGVLICATVIQSEIGENYPNDAYVGKAFAITMTKVPEKKYNLYSIIEIEPDEAQIDPVPGKAVDEEAKPAKPMDEEAKPAKPMDEEAKPAKPMDEEAKPAKSKK